MKRTAAKLGFLVVWIALVGVGEAQVEPKEDPHVLAEVDWFGKNGKSVRGIFVEEKDGVIHVRDLRSKRTYKIARENLSEETLAWFDRAKARDLEGKVAPKPAKRTGLKSKQADLLERGFEPIDQSLLNRARLRPFDPEDYGLNKGNSIAESLAPFFIWWDQNSDLEIPRRSFKSKAKWLYKELSDHLDGSNYSMFSVGLTSYFNENYNDEADFFFSNNHDPSTPRLVQAAQGDCATVVILQIAHGNERSGWRAASLVEAKEDGTVTLFIFRQLVTGKLKTLDKNDKVNAGGNGSPSQELVIDATTPLPTKLQSRNTRIIIDASPTIYRVKPMIKPDKKEDGKD